MRRIRLASINTCKYIVMVGSHYEAHCITHREPTKLVLVLEGSWTNQWLACLGVGFLRLGRDFQLGVCQFWEVAPDSAT